MLGIFLNEGILESLGMVSIAIIPVAFCPNVQRYLVDRGTELSTTAM